MNHNHRGIVWVRILAVGLLCAMGAVPQARAAESSAAALTRLESGAQDLAARLGALNSVLSSILPTGIPLAQPVVRLAQSSQEAGALAVRLSNLEEQFRQLTGQIQGLQFQLVQLQTLLERMQQDIDFRFSLLEGAAAGTTTPAPTTPAPTPTTTIVGDLGGALPPLPPTSVTIPSTADPTQVASLPTVSLTTTPVIPTAPPTLTAANASLPTTTATATPVTLGTPSAPLGTLSLQDLTSIVGLPGQPIDLTNPNPDSMARLADADAQFRAGFEASRLGDYAFAEDQFSRFVVLYPDDPRAPEAFNLLGDALIHRRAFDQAADILLTAFRNYPEAGAAPDILVNLAVALAGAGERDTACRTFLEVTRRYTNLPAAFRTRLADERARARC